MIDSLKKRVSGVLGNTNRATGIITIALLALFVFIAVWFYRKYVGPSLVEEEGGGGGGGYTENGEYSNTLTGGTINVYYFYTAWCPHCNKANPAWNEFKSGYGVNADDIGSYNGREIVFNKVDCDDESKKDLVNSFGVKSFPTIKLVYGGKTYEYDARPDTATLRKFVETSVR